VLGGRLARRFGLDPNVEYGLYPSKMETSNSKSWGDRYTLGLTSAMPGFQKASESDENGLKRIVHGNVLRRGITEREGVSAWDPYILEHGELFRMYYLTQDVTKGRPALFWGRSWIATATSKDLTSWQNPSSIQFTGVGAPEPPPEGETRLLSPCVVLGPERKLYMYLNWAKNYDRKEGRVRLAVSEDGKNFAIVQPPQYSPLGPDVRWLQVEQPESKVAGQFNAQHLAWRDPHVIRGQDGSFYMYITANLHEREDSHKFKLCWPSHLPNRYKLH